MCRAIIRRSCMAPGRTRHIRRMPITRPVMWLGPCLRLPLASVWAWHGVMPGVIVIGAVATSTSTTTRTSTAIEISIAVNTKVETEGKVEIEDKESGSTMPSIAKVFPIATRGPRKNSIARAPTTRSNHENNFAGEQTRDGKTWGVVELGIGDWAVVPEWLIAAEPG